MIASPRVIARILARAWVIASQNSVNSKGLKSKQQVPKKLLPPENLLNRNSTATERRDER
jgi:hypothetical protein